MAFRSRTDFATGKPCRDFQVCGRRWRTDFFTNALQQWCSNRADLGLDTRREDDRLRTGASRRFGNGTATEIQCKLVTEGVPVVPAGSQARGQVERAGKETALPRQDPLADRQDQFANALRLLGFSGHQAAGAAPRSRKAPARMLDDPANVLEPGPPVVQFRAQFVGGPFCLTLHEPDPVAGS